MKEKKLIFLLMLAVLLLPLKAMAEVGDDFENLSNGINFIYNQNVYEESTIINSDNGSFTLDKENNKVIFTNFNGVSESMSYCDNRLFESDSCDETIGRELGIGIFFKNSEDYVGTEPTIEINGCNKIEIKASEAANYLVGILLKANDSERTFNITGNGVLEISVTGTESINTTTIVWQVGNLVLDGNVDINFNNIDTVHSANAHTLLYKINQGDFAINKGTINADANGLSKAVAKQGSASLELVDAPHSTFNHNNGVVILGIPESQSDDYDSGRGVSIGELNFKSGALIISNPDGDNLLSYGKDKKSFSEKTKFRYSSDGKNFVNTFNPIIDDEENCNYNECYEYINGKEIGFFGYTYQFLEGNNLKIEEVYPEDIFVVDTFMEIGLFKIAGQEFFNGIDYNTRLNEDMHVEITLTELGYYELKSLAVDNEDIEIVIKDSLGLASITGNMYHNFSSKTSGRIIADDVPVDKTDILPPEEIVSGSVYKVNIKGTDITSSISKDEINLINKSLPNGSKVLRYLDLSIFVQKDDEPEQKLTSTNKPIEFKIELPDKSEYDGKELMVVRNHEGKVEKIDSEIVEGYKQNGESSEKNIIKFKSGLFSTYAIVAVDPVKETEKEPVKEPEKNITEEKVIEKKIETTPEKNIVKEKIKETNPETGDNIGYSIAGMVISALGIITLSKKVKED